MKNFIFNFCHSEQMIFPKISRRVLGDSSPAVGRDQDDRKKSYAWLVRLLIIPILLVMPAADPALAMGRTPKIFKIEMSIDFGPAGKPAHSETLEVEKGTTPKEAVSQVFSMLSGKSCCSVREVIAIDGVKVDPAKDRWWICLLNGSKDVSPQKYKLKPGDRVEWKYVENWKPRNNP